MGFHRLPDIRLFSSARRVRVGGGIGRSCHWIVAHADWNSIADRTAWKCARNFTLLRGSYRSIGGNSDAQTCISRRCFRSRWILAADAAVDQRRSRLVDCWLPCRKFASRRLLFRSDCFTLDCKRRNDQLGYRDNAWIGFHCHYCDRCSHHDRHLWHNI